MFHFKHLFSSHSASGCDRKRGHSLSLASLAQDSFYFSNEDKIGNFIIYAHIVCNVNNNVVFLF